MAKLQSINLSTDITTTVEMDNKFGEYPTPESLIETANKATEAYGSVHDIRNQMNQIEFPEAAEELQDPERLFKLLTDIKNCFKPVE